MRLVLTDAGATLSAYAPALQSAAFLALSLAVLFVGTRIWRRGGRATSAENEALRDEVWRLKEAASARDRAEAANEAKSRFLATISHEIRTPLSAIIGMAELLRQSSLSLENASYVEAIRSSGSALIALIDEILDLSKIEAGRLGVAVETVDLVRLVEGVVELLAPRAQSKGLEVASSIEARTPRYVRADPGRLRQVLINLAGNAIKFTDRGGVCVFVAPEGEALRFAVVDTGPGVPAARRAAIFEDFEQGDVSDARMHEGAGLGLAISRRIVRLMGGELALADNPGGGSIFAFAAPLPACAPPRGSESAETRLNSLADRTVLIVANSPFEAPALAARLIEAGAKVERAAGLEPGLAAIGRGRRPDLVIVDCALGSESTNALAAAARAAGAPKSLVLFSPFERRAFGQASLQGFDGWLVKPVRTRSLLERAAAEPPKPAIPSPSAQFINARGGRVLLAEDNDINALIAKKALARLGLEVAHARDGAEVLRIAAATMNSRSAAFDLILMDVMMPGLDGLEATKRLRAHEAASAIDRTPVIAVTAHAREIDRDACLAAGFDAFLTKPFDFAELAEIVGRLCRNGPPMGLEQAS